MQAPPIPPNMSLRKTLILNLRWHRRLGLLAAFFVVMLAITGLLINHAPALGLDKSQIKSSALNAWYGIDSPDLRGTELLDRWLIHDGDRLLYWGGRSIGYCAPQLKSAVSLGDFIAVLCAQELLLFTRSGELIERIDGAELPSQPTLLAAADGRLILQSSAGPKVADLYAVTWSAYEGATDTLTWGQVGAVPDAILHNLDSAAVPGVSWQQLLLDIHSGQFFGGVGVFIIDLVAVIFCLLALTGVWAWINYARLRKRGGQ